MGFWSEIWEEVKAEPWGVPACPKSDDFLYFRYVFWWQWPCGWREVSVAASSDTNHA